MHTWIRKDGDTYTIGMWLIHPEGYHRFTPLFDVVGSRDAVTAVNVLNGGPRHRMFKIVREHGT